MPAPNIDRSGCAIRIADALIRDNKISLAISVYIGSGEAGLLTVPSGTHAVRWLPPLNVSREEIDEAGEILGRVLASFRPR